MVRSAKSGTLPALVAGNHGYEYSPILATQWPGKPGGARSKPIAYQITEDIVSQADALTDIHGGDGERSLSASVHWCANAEVDARGDGDGVGNCGGLRRLRLRPSLGSGRSNILLGHPHYAPQADRHPEERLPRHARRGQRGPWGARGTEWSRAEGGPPSASRFRPGAVEPRHQSLLRSARSWKLPGHGGRTGTHHPLIRPVAEVRPPFARVAVYITGTPSMNRRNPPALPGAIRR